jgi:hypothetical protein
VPKRSFVGTAARGVKWTPALAKQFEQVQAQLAQAQTKSEKIGNNAFLANLG